VDKGIDASLGLEVALLTLQRLRKQGVLQAEVSHIPGVQGRCRCSIGVVGGKITSCYIEDTAGNRYSIGIDVVVATDRKKGPFAWSFHPQAALHPQRPQSGVTQASPAIQPYQTSPVTQNPFQASPATQKPFQASPVQNPHQQRQLLPSPQHRDVISGNTIPIPLKRATDLYWPNGLSVNERVMLGWIFSLVDGQRTVANITVLLPRLRFEDVRSGLLFLQQIGAISLRG
jgi:hypothetical protein